MKLWLISCVAVAASSAAWAQQTSLSSQIDSVYAAQRQQEEAAEAAKQAEADAEARREYEAQREEAEVRASERRREAAVAAREQVKEAEAQADRARDQKFEDQERALKLQEQEITLETEKARAARENDFINRDLAREDAQTDVIKSQADASGNVSSGVKTLLEDHGQAEVKKESGLFH